MLKLGIQLRAVLGRLSKDHRMKLIDALAATTDVGDYFNISSDGKEFSYVPISRLSRLGTTNAYTAPFRQTAKPGRILNKMIKDENTVRAVCEELITLQSKDPFETRIVCGAEVGDWLMIPRTELAPIGQPFESCFQGKLSRTQFTIWERNPDIMKTIIVLYDGKLAGRNHIYLGSALKEDRAPAVLGDFPKGNTQVVRTKLALALAEFAETHGLIAIDGPQAGIDVFKSQQIAAITIAERPPYFDAVRYSVTQHCLYR